VAREPTWCPLHCGFMLVDDFDHFARCFVRHVIWSTLYITRSRVIGVAL
jgi:hypothetical protein